jgi:UDP-glucuronate 4-epimerase
MYKILVTGAAGFIGYHVIQKLLKLNCEVVGLDNINDYYDVQLKYDRLSDSGIAVKDLKENGFTTSTKFPNYRFIKLSLENREAMKQLFEEERFEVVVHLAAQAGVRYSLLNPTAYVDSNVHGFLNVLEGCRNTNVRHLVFASSSSVYGANTKLPFSEEDRTDHPVSLYAATKKANEMMAYSYSSLYKFKTTGLRFFTAYGPWGRPDMAYFIFTDKITKGEPIKLFNAGNMKRDFTFIDDIVQGISNIVTRTLSDIEENIPQAVSMQELHAIYNIGNHKSIEITKLVSIIEQYLGKKAVIESYPMQPGDVENTYAEISKLSKAYGFAPSTDYEIGIQKFVAWYKNYYKV